MPELGTLNRKKIVALGGVASLARNCGTLKGKRLVWGCRAPIRGRALYRRLGRHPAPQIPLRAPDESGLNHVVEIDAHVAQAALEPPDMPSDVAANGRSGVSEPIALGDQHLQHLAAAHQEGIEGLGRIIGERPRLGLHTFGEEGEDGVGDGVGLGELARSGRPKG